MVARGRAVGGEALLPAPHPLVEAFAATADVVGPGIDVRVVTESVGGCPGRPRWAAPWTGCRWRYRPGIARLTLGTVLAVALAADLVRGEDAARLGDAIPFLTAPALAIVILALHHPMWRRCRGAEPLLGWPVVVGLACLTVAVLGI